MSERSLIGSSIKTLTTQLKLMRINLAFMRKRSMLDLRKGKKGIHTRRKPIRDLKLR